MTNSEEALKYIRDGMIVGLGTGSAATAFIRALGERVERGLKIIGVPTSEKSAALAKELGIPLKTLEEVNATLDVCVDGADEFDPQLNLVKGLGGALVREKIVAAAAKQLVILVGPADSGIKRSKAKLGERGVLPVEVVPFALPLCQRKLTELGLAPVLRPVGDKPFVSDNGNYILDCKLKPIDDVVAFERQLLSIPGVVDTGLFIGMADVVLFQDHESLQVLTR